MPTHATKIQTIVSRFGKTPRDCGSSAAQIAVWTAKIDGLRKHFARHAKDHQSRRGLLKMVSRRRRMLNFLKRTNPDGYTHVVARLNLRR